MQSEQAVLNGWSGAAPFWEKHSEILRRMFAPVTQALIEDGRIRSGHTVLDIATGTGEPALSVAAVVGREGRVFGIDPVPEMVAAARRAAEQQGLTNAEFDGGFAENLPFAADTFDAVVSRFGVMFIPTPVPAIREMLRVLKPERRLSLAVWHFAGENPFFRTLTRVLEEYVESPPVAPDAPDTFRYASPGKLRDILGEAGAVAPAERLLPFTIQVPLSAEDYWTLRCEMSESLRAKLALLSSGQVAEVKRKTQEALREYATGGGVNFPAQVLIVSGTKSPSAN